MRTKESQEMYLETILLLKKQKANIRSVDIVEELNYAKSSVSRGVNLLVDNGYITLDHQSGIIEFTPAGLKKAQDIYDRHCTLTLALEKMGAEPKSAEENACRIEHVITDDVFHVVKEFVKKS